MATDLNATLQQLADQLPGCLHTSIIDGATGMALVSISSVDPLDAAGTDAYHNDLYRLARSLLEESPVDAGVQEVVITSSEGQFVSIPAAETGYLWLVVTRRDTTLGFIQAMMRKHVEGISHQVQSLVS